jgi:predicted enzyme related to lactoylglutathione lyase
MAPTFGNGKICYIVMPAADIAVSADFYSKVFGWSVRTRADGSAAFDDGVGEVSGTWVLGREPVSPNTLQVHIMVDAAVKTLELVAARGGQIVQPIGADAPEITALFRDPAGNVLGIYQHRSSRNRSAG